jgi:predicted MFS family arabinose efflux permease
VGVLGGTVFFCGLVIAKLGSARLTKRFGAGGAVRTSLLAAVAGNAIIAASPIFAGVAAGRVLSGISLGLALVLGPVLARATGSVRMIGRAGAAMRAAGIDWRLDFVLAAGLAAGALAAMPDPGEAEVTSGSVIGLARRSVRRLPAWRLELLFMTALGVPYVLGVWLIPYLTDDVGFSAGLAGALGIVLFAMAAILRPEGARLEADGTSLSLLGGIAPLIAAAGLILLAFSDLAVVAVAGVILAGIGFAVPYATMYDEAARLFPDAKVASVGLFSVGANVLPAVVTPFVGAAIAADRGELAVLALAGLTIAAGLANLRPPVRT